MDIINDCIRRARKKHVCDLCCDDIQKGSRYKYQFNSDGGEHWNFRAHERCWHLAQELWEYLDPYEYMDSDCFNEGMRSFCREFICPQCLHFDPNNECMIDESYCIDKIDNLLKNYYVKSEYNRNNPIFRRFQLIKR